LDALTLFYDLRQLAVNLGKTKVTIFNGLKKTSDLHFFLIGEEIEIANTYTYLGVQFLGLHFSLRLSLQPLINKGYRSLALLERVLPSPFSGYLIQDVPHGIPYLTHYSLWLRGLGIFLLESDWASVERVHTLLI